MVNVRVPEMASKMDELNQKVVFITNRGGTHPNRVLYFDSIKSDYQFVDFKVRWHGLKVSKWKIIISGIVCALTFPNRKQYSLFVTSDPQLPAALMKVFGILRKDQKVVSYLGSQTLYFIYSGYYSKFTTLFYKFILKKYDAHICNGDIQRTLLKKIIDVPDDKVFVNINGIRSNRFDVLKKVKYNALNTDILFIGNIYSDWRIHYKGIDLLLEAFSSIRKNLNITLTIVGDFDDSLLHMVHSKIPADYVDDIKIVGPSNDLVPFFEKALVYVHPSRGDALPNSLLEALFSGIPSIASDLTGHYKIIENIDPAMVCNIEINSLINSMLHFIKLPEAEKLKYSKMSRESCITFTEENAVKKFQSIIKKISTE